MSKKRKKIISKFLPPILTPKKVPKFDPNIPIEDMEQKIVDTSYTVYTYNENRFDLLKTELLDKVYPEEDKSINMWVNIDGLKKKDVEQICEHFAVDRLLVEDILSLGQRSKYDDMQQQLFFILPMLTYNEDTKSVDIEQLSIILGDNYILSFQPDPNKDPFDQVRDRIKFKLSQIRKRKSDFLCYALMDAIIDDYYLVFNKLSDVLETMDDEILTEPRKDVLLRLNFIRRELMVIKRQISPVREVINTIYNLDSPLIDKSSKKYFKDIYDHINLASEYIDNYRELSMNLQDLYMNQVNTKMNQVMKVLTIVTALLAPFTVIGSIFGMNFDKIPYAHNQYGFYLLILVMFGFSGFMLYYFYKKDWF